LTQRRMGVEVSRALLVVVGIVVVGLILGLTGALDDVVNVLVGVMRLFVRMTIGIG
jgi:hypothetical protein